MIRYHIEQIPFKLAKKQVITNWIKSVISFESNHQMVPGDINIILCSDEYLLEINKKFLSHDYFTDIITFDYCEGKRISGDLFISVDTVEANSSTYGTLFHNELYRVIIHGVLHLLGYNDKSKDEIIAMKEAEDRALQNLLILING